MRNILNEQPETKFTGKEILDWANFQIENETADKEEAMIILDRFSNIEQNRFYQVVKAHDGRFGCLIYCRCE